MSDWTCRVSSPASRELVLAQLSLVLADGMSTPDVQARALEIARDHYGPGAHINEVTPEDWISVRPRPNSPKRIDRVRVGTRVTRAAPGGRPRPSQERLLDAAP